MTRLGSASTVSMNSLAEAMRAEPAVGHLHELEASAVGWCRNHATGAMTSCVVCGEWVFVPPLSTAPSFVVEGLDIALRMLER